MICPECKGKKKVVLLQLPLNCKTCKGTGSISVVEAPKTELSDGEISCFTCNDERVVSCVLSTDIEYAVPCPNCTEAAVFQSLFQGPSPY